MADTNFLMYKGKPLVRKGDTIFYGDMNEKYVVRFTILSSKKDGKLDIADKVSIALLPNAETSPKKAKPEKESTKDSLFAALDLGFTWLERALKN